MKNAMKNNMTTPVRSLGRWRMTEDLKKGPGQVLAWFPNLGGSHWLVPADPDVLAAHGIKYWQPLDAPPV